MEYRLGLKINRTQIQAFTGAITTPKSKKWHNINENLNFEEQEMALVVLLISPATSWSFRIHAEFMEFCLLGE